MKVSVVIPAYNEELLLAHCLQCLKGQLEPADEIIVVDNNSTDATAAIAASFSGVRVIRESTQGMIPARNCGFDYAKGDIIARTDADTRVPHDWIKKIKKQFVKNPKLLGLSGPLHFYDVPDILQHKNWPAKMSVQTAVSRVMKHDGMLGPNMALRKKAWQMVRDEICQNDNEVHEDMDLAIHLAQHGKVCFDENIVVESSFRRWKKLEPYFEYPYRYIKTVEKHKKWLTRLKKATSVKRAIRRTHRGLKRTLAYTMEKLS